RPVHTSLTCNYVNLFLKVPWLDIKACGSLTDHILRIPTRSCLTDRCYQHLCCIWLECRSPPHSGSVVPALRESLDISIEDQPRPGPSVLRRGQHSFAHYSGSKTESHHPSSRENSWLFTWNGTVIECLHEVDFRKLLSTWIPHELRDSDEAS
ncbi:hypothetical protein ANCDUO_26437, partial [Ancylostoma duodenale]